MNSLKQKLLVWLLKQLKPGYLPEPIWLEMQRLNMTVAVEMSLSPGDASKVLLQKRPDTDRFWPGKYHLPGTIVRADETVLMALERLCSEIGVSSREGADVKFMRHYDYVTERGNITHLVFSVRGHLEIAESGIFKAFGLTNLPKKMVKHNRLFLEGKL